MPGYYNSILPVLIFLFTLTGCGETKRLSKRQQLLSGSWTYSLSESKNNAIRVPNDTIKILLKFNGDSILGGHTGCNEFWGNYSLKGGKIVFYNIAMTRKMCEGITWEHDLITALKNTVNLEIKSKSLKLETKDIKHLYWIKYIDNQ